MATLLLAACGDAPARPAPRAAGPDKASLFGDPALMPTRAAEHARRELAVAGQLESLMRMHPGITEVRADVTLPPPAAFGRRALTTHARATVVALASRPSPALRTEATAIARGVLGEGAGLTLTVTDPHPGDATSTTDGERGGDPPRRDLDLPLALALLGLGASLGVTLDRAWARRRLRRLRRASGRAR